MSLPHFPGNMKEPQILEYKPLGKPLSIHEKNKDIICLKFINILNYLFGNIKKDYFKIKLEGGSFPKTMWLKFKLEKTVILYQEQEWLKNISVKEEKRVTSILSLKIADFDTIEKYYMSICEEKAKKELYSIICLKEDIESIKRLLFVSKSFSKVIIKQIIKIESSSNSLLAYDRTFKLLMKHFDIRSIGDKQKVIDYERYLTDKEKRLKNIKLLTK